MPRGGENRYSVSPSEPERLGAAKLIETHLSLASSYLPFLFLPPFIPAALEQLEP